METKVICPNCGAEIEIAKHEHAATGVVIGEDSNLGIVKLPLKNKPKTAQERRDILAKRGFDVSNIFALGDMLVRPNESHTIECVDDDPVITSILNKGYMRNPQLFKQHVMAQFLKLATRCDGFNENGDILLHKYRTENHSLTAWSGRVRSKIRNLSCDYAWHVVEMKLGEVVAALHNGDIIGAEETKLWYDRQLVIDMLEDYIKQMHSNYLCLRNHSFKGQKYVRIDATKLIGGSRKGLLLSDWQKFIDAIRKYVERVKLANGYDGIYSVIKEWNHVRPAFGRDLVRGANFTPVVPECWVNAYEGYGAYFTAQNCIKFHGLRIHPNYSIKAVTYKDYSNVTELSDTESLDVLAAYSRACHDESWKVTGLLRQMIIDNHFDIEKKFNEWMK